MMEHVIVGLFIGIPVLLMVGVGVAALRRRSQTFDDV